MYQSQETHFYKYQTKDKVEIKDDGYWYINDVKSGKAQGPEGPRGSSIKKIDTWVRRLSYADWTTPAENKDSAYTEIGHEELWWDYEEGYRGDNGDIEVGDLAYLVGEVTDRQFDDGQPQTVIIYGEVTRVIPIVDAGSIHVSGVQMKTTQVVWGGQQGKRGPQGDAPCVLSLTNDQEVIAKNNAGTYISTFPIECYGSLYQGKIEVSTGVTYKWTTPGGETIEDDSLIIEENIYSGEKYGSGNYTLTATYDGVTYTKVFKVTEITSQVDYSLIVPSIANITHASQSFAVKVLKTGKGYATDDDDTEILEGPGEHDIKIWVDGTEWGVTDNNWNNITVDKQTKITLKNAEGTITWDEEIIEVVTDGTLIGRNLLLNTGATGKNITVVGSNISIAGCSPSLNNGVLQLTSSNIDSEEIFYRFMDPTSSQNTFYSLDPTKIYTFSGKVKGSIQNNASELIKPYVAIRYGSYLNGWGFDTQTTLLEGASTTWIPFSAQVKIAEGTTGFYLSLQIYHTRNNSTPFSCTYQFKDLKLEEGNVATQWSPAPEDVAAEINTINALIGSVQTDLQNQIDGAISSWFEDNAPKPQKINGTIESEANYPANQWTSDDEQIKHEGDLYYDKESGQCYRWVCDKVGNAHGYHYWTLIQDNAIAEALEAANDAQATADGKMTVFSDENLPANDSVQTGDLWIPSVDYSSYKQGKVYKCTVTGSGESRQISWDEIKYTDDTAANAAQKAADNAQKAADDANNQYTTLSGDISSAGTIFQSGLSKTTSKDIINKFELAASSIIVYNKDTDDDNIIFKAESSKDKNGNYVAGGAVYLAGWTATEDQLTNTPENTTIGQANTFGIYPKGISNDSLHDSFKWYGQMDAGDSWIMSAGQNFGLTKNGVLYANKGRIGNMAIGDIASKNDVTVGRNLAKKSAISAFNGTISESEYHYTITKTDANAGLKVNSSIFTVGKNYVISYKFTITKGTGINSISGHCQQQITKVVLDGVTQETGSYPNSGFVLSDKNPGVEHSLVLYMKYTGTGVDNNFYIQPERNTTGNIEEFIVWDLKVEEGEVRSPWIVPFEDQLSPEATGNYSWQFSPSQGIKMWNGAQTTANEVFKIDDDGLSVKGKIIATSLELGTNKISTDNISGLSNIATSGDYDDLSNKPSIPTSITDLTNGREVMYDGDVQISTSTTGGITTQTITYGANTYTTKTSTDGKYVLTDVGLGKGSNSPSATSEGSYFCVSTEGLLKANNAIINGTIYATNGTFSGKIVAEEGDIGGINIVNDGLASSKDSITNWALSSSGLSFNTENSVIQFNGFQIKNEDSSKSIIQATNELKLQGSGASLSFIPLQGSTLYVALYMVYTETGAWPLKLEYCNMTLKLVDKDYNEQVSDVTRTFSFTFERGNNGEFTRNFTIKAGDSSSNTIEEPFDDLSGNLYVKLNDTQWKSLFTMPQKDKVTRKNTIKTIYSPNSHKIQCTGDLLGDDKSSLGNETNPWKSSTINTLNIRTAIRGDGTKLQFYSYPEGSTQSGTIIFNQLEYTSSGVSDVRKKKNIEPLPYEYELLFDDLRPTRYKYIDGTSDRYHTGYIAQEVVESLQKCQLTTKDFAAVVLQDPGEETEVWQLRRDEFVALNTWQIQKLKPRVSALEQTITNYEARISTLEKQIQNLTNT